MQQLDLTGKRAIITGSSAGIGLAIAKQLLEHGASIILNGRSHEKLQKIKQELSSISPKTSIDFVEADLGTAEGASKLIQHFSDCDILINNLGIYFPRPFEESSDDDWNHIWEVNVMSGVRLSRHYLKGMLSRNWGRILFISSESALQIPAEMIHYGVTKTAQIAVARGIAELTMGSQVTSNSILVGPTFSEGVKDFIDSLAQSKKTNREQVEKEFFQDMRPTSLLKRFIKPDEVATLVAYLSSPASSAINGAAIRADGGVVKSII